MTGFMFADGDRRQFAVLSELSRLRTANPVLFMQITQDVTKWMSAETLAPQQIDLVPFPIKRFESNAFYTAAGNVSEAYAFSFL